MRRLLVQIGQGESLVHFLCPALPTRPSQAVVVVKRGIDWQREKWQSWLGSKFIHQGEKMLRNMRTRSLFWAKECRTILRKLMEEKRTLCMQKGWRPVKYPKPSKISTVLKHQKALFQTLQIKSCLRSKTGKIDRWMRYIRSSIWWEGRFDVCSWHAWNHVVYI